MVYVWLSSGFCMALPIKYCLKNEQERIISFKNARWSQEFLCLIMLDCDFFDRLQNLWYRSTHSCTNNNLDLGLLWSKKLDLKFSHVFIRYKDTN